MKDKFVKNCPFCGGEEMVEAYQGGYAAVSGVENAFGSSSIRHVICRNCGSVVRSYATKPEKLLKKKDRKRL